MGKMILMKMILMKTTQMKMTHGRRRKTEIIRSVISPFLMTLLFISVFSASELYPVSMMVQWSTSLHCDNKTIKYKKLLVLLGISRFTYGTHVARVTYTETCLKVFQFFGRES